MTDPPTKKPRRRPTKSEKCGKCGAMFSRQGIGLHKSKCAGTSPSPIETPTPPASSADPSTTPSPKRSGGILSGDGGIFE